MILAAVLGVAALACALFLPRYLPAWDLGTAKPPADYATAVNNIRTALLHGVGGLVLLIGAYLTWRQLQLSRHGQTTESFAAAIATGASLKRVVFDETTAWPGGFDTSLIRSARPRTLPPIRPRDYGEFAAEAVSAEIGSPEPVAPDAAARVGQDPTP